MTDPATGKSISGDDLPEESSQELKYKGVRKRKWGKWVSEIRLPNSRERIWLGSYDRPEKAARAFDAAQYCLRGPHAKFNFPDSPPEIAGGERFSAAEIQAFAAKFAGEYGGGRREDPEREEERSDTELCNVGGYDGAVDGSFFDVLDTFDGGNLDLGFENIIGRNEQFYDINIPFPVQDMDRDMDMDMDMEEDEALYLWNFDTYNPRM